jgi:hypothetical protein
MDPDADPKKTFHEVEGDIIKASMRGQAVEKAKLNEPKVAASVVKKVPPAPKPHFKPTPQPRVIRRSAARGR